MSDDPRSVRVTRGRRTLVVLVSAFALPLLLAWLLVIGPPGWRPSDTVNHGLLVQPPLPLDRYGVLDSSGQSPARRAAAEDWFLVVLDGAGCGATCRGLLEIAERIHIAVGADGQRVEVVLLGPGEGPPALGRRWHLPPDGRLMAALHEAAGAPRFQTLLLIVDQRGHVVLLYPPSEDGRGALDDLKRLLRATARP